MQNKLIDRLRSKSFCNKDRYIIEFKFNINIHYTITVIRLTHKTHQS